MWFFNVYQEYGIDAANRLNRATPKNSPGIRIGRLVKAFTIDANRDRLRVKPNQECSVPQSEALKLIKSGLATDITNYDD